MRRESIPSRKHPLLIRAIVVASVLAAAVQDARATTRHVGNAGTDGPSCGATTAPCRSISKAIANAAAGDTIVVGPGRYGDVNRDGDFADPGDEAAELGSGCNCMIKVDKPVKLKSRDGMGPTVIDTQVGPGPLHATGVVITAPGVVFGQDKYGFTILKTGDAYYGLEVQFGADGSAVEGNLFVETGGLGFSASSGAVEDNWVIGGSASISVDGSFNVVRGNLMSGSTLGISVFGGEKNLVRQNVVVGGIANGINVDADTTSVVRNAAISNSADGISYQVGSLSGVVTGNAVYGNGIGSGDNAGVRNAGAGAFALVATGNYWGAATGPGLDPADEAADDTGNGITSVPFAAKDPAIKLKPLR